MLPLAEYNKWLKTAVPYARLTYHTGDLMYDAYTQPTEIDKNLRLDFIAKEIYKSYTNGLVILFQRRVGVSCWDYLSVRVPTTIKALRSPPPLPRANTAPTRWL